MWAVQVILQPGGGPVTWTRGGSAPPGSLSLCSAKAGLGAWWPRPTASLSCSTGVLSSEGLMHRAWGGGLEGSQVTRALMLLVQGPYFL